MMFSLTGKVALVTGGSSGIGLAIAQRFVKAGALVSVVDLNNCPSELDAHFVRADVSREAELAAAFSSIHSRHGRLDIVVNNAGIQPLGVGFADLTQSLMERTFAVNLLGVAYGIRLAGQFLGSGGRVINTGSFVGIIGVPSAAVYGTSKAAVIHMSREAALELAPRKITVNCVCPGTVRTPAVLEIPDNPEIPFVENATPVGRLADPDEVAAAFHFLASDDASYVTGAVLCVDGGICAGWREYPVIPPANIVDGKWRD
jgi:NAD(P)-dependent dehydrogenase (short-subunit alcohol dehydrogenase family)